MNSANVFHRQRTGRTGARGRLLGLVGATSIWLVLVGLPLPAAAAPDAIDSLIDGPLPQQISGLTAIPDLLFTASGLLCKKAVVKVMHDVTCTGDMPGTPAGTRVVSLGAVYAQADGPARVLPTPPERFFGDTSGQTPVALPAGHKIVFWAFSDTQSLACGAPPPAKLVCRLNGRAGDRRHQRRPRNARLRDLEPPGPGVLKQWTA